MGHGLTTGLKKWAVRRRIIRETKEDTKGGKRDVSRIEAENPWIEGTVACLEGASLR
jgi:hypothetical protein